MIYKLYSTTFPQSSPNAAMTVNVEPSKSFLFDPANTDYQAFKKDLANGAELQDADGNVIDGIAYLEELA
jgi:hypothetical protein